MNGGRLHVAILAIPLIAGLAPSESQGAACAPRPAPDTVTEEQTVETASMELDALYHRALKNAEALVFVWKQQPDNRAALRNYVVELRGDVSALADAAGDERAAEAPAPGTSQEAGTAEARPPAGPVKPATGQTPEDEARRREAATLDRFRGTPPIGDPLETRTLAGVEPDAIRAACSRAVVELDKIDTVLEGNDVEPEVMEAALTGLQAILLGMSEPTASPTS